MRYWKGRLIAQSKDTLVCKECMLNGQPTSKEEQWRCQETLNRNVEARDKGGTSVPITGIEGSDLCIIKDGESIRSTKYTEQSSEICVHHSLLISDTGPQNIQERKAFHWILVRSCWCNLQVLSVVHKNTVSLFLWVRTRLFYSSGSHKQCSYSSTTLCLGSSGSLIRCGTAPP